MKQQVIIFVSILVLLALIFGFIAVFAKGHSTVSTDNASPNTPLLATPNATVVVQGASDKPQPSGQASAPVVSQGAVEIEASQSANRGSARVVQVTLTNGKSFTLALYEDLAPQTVKQFIANATSNVYNGTLFFRVEKGQDGKPLLIQGGDPTNSGNGGGVMQAEYNKKPFKAGSVGIARGQNRDLNNGTQFFIVIQDIPMLDGEYSNFGDVIDGMDVVASIKQGQPIRQVTIIQ